MADAEPRKGPEARRAGGRGPRTFTAESANATLPFVRAVMRDAMEKWKELARLRELLSGEAEGRPLDERRRGEALDDAARIEDGVRECLRELEEVGVAVKSLDTGLLDFPCRAGGRIVELCWRAGEESVTHWHDVGAGFPGRRPLSELPA